MLLCLGPLMISALLFRPLSWAFDSWLRQTMNYSLLLALVSATLSVIAGLFEFLLAGAEVGQSNMGQMLAVIVIGGTAGLFLLVQLPGLCAGLTGGAALSISRPLHQMASVAKFGKAAGGAAGRGAAAVGRTAARTFVTGHPPKPPGLPTPPAGQMPKLPALPTPPALAGQNKPLAPTRPLSGLPSHKPLAPTRPLSQRLKK